jgi:hypothetical protein
MPARDIYHDAVKHALEKDGWTITHDPLKLKLGRKEMYVNLGAERLLAAEKGGQKIAIEIKSFIGSSQLHDLEEALGQFVLYHDVLTEVEPERVLYLAVSQKTYTDLFEEPLGLLLLKNNRAQLIIFDPSKEVILKWIP